MDNLKKLALRTQQFVTDHKVAIAVTSTATVTTAGAVRVIRGIVQQRDDFLAENGLLEKFYETLDKSV